MSITASLSDTLVPVLDASGSNWAIFVFRFQDAVEAKGFWGHFDGSSVPPVFADVSAPTAAETVAKAQWDKDERSARSLLMQRLLDSTVVLIHGKKTVKERWEAVVREFSRKSTYAQADLRARFMGMLCPERGNPREFLEGLQMKKEELAQAGVVVDEKDYFSVIISSLPVALSNFASNQLAAAQFLLSRRTPDDLLSMLVEESDRQRAQRQCQRGSGKGKDEESEEEALTAGSGKPKRNRANVTCWTCDKVGHYSCECEKPSESDDEPKDQETSKDNATVNNVTAAILESDDECRGAWAAEEVEDKLDWFERAVSMMDNDGKSVVPEIPVRDWFDEVIEGEKESKDEKGNSKDALVDDFDRDASGGAFIKEGMVVSGTGACMRTVPEDSGITSLFRPCCDDIEGTGTLPSTLLGSITPVVDLEGEYEDGETICETSIGMEPDLGVLGNPWIDDATMEWNNHAIILRASAEVVTHLDNPREGEGTPDVQVCESCDVGVIGVTWDLEEAEMVGKICKEHLLVPCFEGEEDDQCETMDSPAAEYPTTQIESPSVEVIDRAPNSMFRRDMEVPPNVLNSLVDGAKFAEGLETRCHVSTTHISRFEPFSVDGTYEKGQRGVEDLDEGGGLTTVDTVHLERPPGSCFVSVDPPTVKTFDLGDFALKISYAKLEESLPSVVNVPAGCMKFIEGAETVEVKWVMSVAIVCHFEPSWAIGICGKGKVDVERLYRGGGHTLGGVSQLLRPPW